MKDTKESGKFYVTFLNGFVKSDLIHSNTLIMNSLK